MNEQDLAALTEVAKTHSNGRIRNGWLEVRCPYPHHSDKAGKHAGFNLQYGFVKCFSHDVIKGKDLANAWGVQLSTYTPHMPYTAPERPTPPPKPPVLWDEEWVIALSCHAEALDYLNGRGIPDNIALHYRLGFTGTDKRLPEWAWHRIAIPWIEETFTEEGWQKTVKGVKIRKLPSSKANISYLSIPDSLYEGWFNYSPRVLRKEVVIQETELDAISLGAKTGLYHLSIASPAGSVTLAKTLLLWGYKVWVCSDDDGAGMSMFETIKGFMPRAMRLLPVAGYKDFSASYPQVPEWVNKWA